MKILFLAPDTNLFYEMRGGAGTHMRASVSELSKLGHDVILAIGGDLLKVNNQKQEEKIIKDESLIKNNIKKIIPNEIKKTITDYNIKKRNIQVRKKAQEIIEENPEIDIIYERSGYGYDTGMYLSEKYNIPRCMETDVIMLDLKKDYTSILFNKYIYRKLEKKKYATADSITVQSDYSVELCKEYWGIKHDRVFNKDLGINKSNLEINPNLDVDKKHNIKDKIVIGFVGYFMGYQNIPLLLDVAKMFQSASSDVVFLLVGGGGVYDKLIDKAKDEGINNVIFTGLVDKENVANYYARIDLAVIPDCAYHMYPVKFLEYSLFKLPTVTPNYSVFRRFYENDSKFNEMTCFPKNVDSFYETLNKNVQKLYQLKKDVSYTYNYVLENHRWERCGKLIEHALIETLNFRDHSKNCVI